MPEIAEAAMWCRLIKTHVCRECLYVLNLGKQNWQHVYAVCSRKRIFCEMWLVLVVCGVCFRAATWRPVSILNVVSLVYCG